MFSRIEYRTRRYGTRKSRNLGLRTMTDLFPLAALLIGVALLVIPAVGLILNTLFE